MAVGIAGPTLSVPPPISEDRKQFENVSIVLNEKLILI
jgi:hypothetical protein